MKNTVLFTLILCISPHFIQAQSLLISPYLQDVEPNSAKIMWESSGGMNHSVEWGLNQGNLNQTSSASSITSQGSNLINTAQLSGLAANTRYYYRVVSDNEVSLVFDFITAPTKSSDQSFNLIAMSDMQRDGSNPEVFGDLVSNGIIAYFEQEFNADLPANLGFVMIPGDLVVNGNTYSQWKNHFFDPASPLFSHVPVYPVLGNHENNSNHYFKYFELPSNGTTGYEEHWWYKDYSNVRIIGINSNSGYRIQTQLDWLETVLNQACSDPNIDFVFTQLHHPHKSELWTPGEISYTGEVIALMETFTAACNKPSIHFFGHTHGYSRGQSRDHEHLWVNVATAGGAIDNWGEFPNADYEEFSKSIDEYGFVVINVTAGASPQFTLKRISRGDQNTTLNNIQQDLLTIKKSDAAPQQPVGLFPNGETLSPDCITLIGNTFLDPGDTHQASHWQVASTCNDFSNPIFESWKQNENWYNEINTQANDILTDEKFTGFDENSSYCWRVRYRDGHLKWSDWSTPNPFQTGTSDQSSNLLLNPGGENGVTHWIQVTGTIESLGSGECNGTNPHSGNKYLAVGGLCDGSETSYSEYYQMINISTSATEIDAGSVEVEYGGYFSNFGGSDRPAMHLVFLNSAGTEISSTSDLTTLNSNWTLLENTELIPVNTRRIKVVITGTRNAGTDNDSYFDDLKVQLDFTPGDDCSQVLPVKLIRFTAECVDKKAVLHWEVAEEQNISTYQIERSFDGVKWVITGVESPLNSSEPRTNYTHQSWESINGKPVYYRLNIFEMDGTSSYSPIVSVNCSNPHPVINIFPNPVTENQFNLFIYNPYKAPVNIQIKNILGQSIYQQEKILDEGEHKLLVEGVTNWAPGIYSLTIHTKEWSWSEKLIRE